MQTGNKSSVAEFLTEKAKVPRLESITLQGSAALFIDGLLLLENREKQTLRGFSGYTWTLCYREESIVVLFDRHRRKSIKATTRGRRSKSMAQIVGRVRREVPLQVFPALGEKKADLARFLSAGRIAQPAV